MRKKTLKSKESSLAVQNVARHLVFYVSAHKCPIIYDDLYKSTTFIIFVQEI